MGTAKGASRAPGVAPTTVDSGDRGFLSGCLSLKDIFCPGQAYEISLPAQEGT